MKCDLFHKRPNFSNSILMSWLSVQRDQGLLLDAYRNDFRNGQQGMGRGPERE